MDAARIASLFYPAIEPQLADAAGLWSQVDTLRALVRKHLPPITASLFARARTVSTQPQRIQWYSDLAGGPTPLDDLTDADRSRVLALVKDRLNSIRQLAEHFQAGINADGTAGAASSDLLQRAARYPHQSCVYVISGEPVLVFWGLELPRGMRRSVGPTTDPPKGLTASPRRRLALLSAAALLALACLFTLGLGGWHWYQQQVRDELAAELSAGLGSHCESMPILRALHARLEQIDPDGSRFPEIWTDTQHELDRCADAKELEAQLTAARTDCSVLPAIADTLTYQDASRPPFSELQSRLSILQARCGLAEELDKRLDSLDGDCAGILALAREHPLETDASYPLAESLTAIATAGQACKIVSDLRPRFAQANGDCETLRALARELGQRRTELSEALFNPTPDLFADIQAEFDHSLERCRLADHLTSRLAGAQGDCIELASLREIVARQGDQAPPFAGVVSRLDEALGQCAALSELEIRFVQAQGDCPAVRQLSDELEHWRDNLRFVTIRARIKAEETICAQANALEQRIAAAGKDCDSLRGLADEINKHSGSPFTPARQTLKAKLDRCEVRKRLTALLDAAGTHCGRLKAAQRAITRESGDDVAALRQRVTKALEPCRPKPAKVKPPRGAGTYALSGACNGTLVISPSGGYHRDPVRHIVSITPPANRRIGKVVSDNRGCRNCRLKKRNATTWSVQLYYGCSGRGTVPIAYSAYDLSGKLVCSGKGTAHCLGRRRP